MKQLFLLILLATSSLGYAQTDTTKIITMNKYLLHGKLTAKAGHAEELATILIEASKLVSTANGCKLYVISKDKEDSNSIYVTEIWDSKQDHDNALKIDAVRALIIKAMPILDQETPPTKGQELELLGGSGI